MNTGFSIVIPVYNEQEIINQTIGHTRMICEGHDYEIIVVDGNPSKNTIESIKDKEVIKIVSERGRGRQMNAGASASKKDILLFLHADTKLPDNALKKISDVILNNRFVGGAFDLGIESDRYIYRIIEKIVYYRTRITKIPYGDQAIFIKKDFFKEMNGYKEIPIMEDVELMLRIKRLKKNIFIIPDKVKTSSRRWEKEGIIYCTLRNWLLIILFFLGFPPEKLVKYYYPNGVRS